MKRLNIGCGSVQPEGWVHIDREDYGQAWIADMLQVLPFATGTFDYAVANHSLQVLGYHDLPIALRELQRVLKDDGVIRILVPDVLEGFRAAERGDASWFPIADEVSPWAAVKLSIWLTWYGTNLTAFTPTFLEHCLREAGFVETTCVDYGETTHGDPRICDLDDRQGESFIMEARCVSA